MKLKVHNAFLLSILAILFTIGLTFASIELPKITDDLFHEKVNFVDVYTGGGDLQEIKTELFIKHFHLRTIGYVCLLTVIVLIIIGFITERTGLSTLGAFAIFLPVFGHFAATMFFLGGLGFLRLLWLPGLDISFDIMNLGNAVFIPYRIIIDGFNLIGINLHSILPYFFIVFGLLIFCFGTLVWFYTYFTKSGVAKIKIYGLTRHPQYLGWIIWSYGILFLPGVNMKQSYSISDSLPWLISTLIIIGIAMLEEIKMSKIYGDEYEDYRKNSFFMLPFPKYICRVISAPFRVFFNKNFPTKRREIVTVLSFYFVLTVLLTLTLNNAATMIAPGKWVFESDDTRSIEELVTEFIETPERRDKYKISELLIQKGDSALPYFINFLNHSDFVIREFSVDALGKLNKVDAIEPLIQSLQDTNRKVVNSVLRSLGNYKSDKAVDALILLLSDEDNNNISLAAGALMKIGTKRALEYLIPLAEEERISPSAELILALGNNESERTEALITKYMKINDVELRRAAVIGATKFNSSKITNSLNVAINDDDWEVRLYAEEVLENLKSK